MAKRSELSRESRNARRQAQRRIVRLDAVIQSDSASARMKRLAATEKYEIKKAMFASKQVVNIGGKRVTHDKALATQGLQALKKAVAEVAPRFSIEGDTFEVVQRELNRASVGAPSVYTKQETRILYRATQNIWQKKGIGEHDRNEAILNHFNNIRKENGLAPVSFEEVVNEILAANERIQKQQKVDPSKQMSEEEKKDYEEAQKGDTADHDKISPIGEAAAQQVMDAVNKLFVLPDATSI